MENERAKPPKQQGISPKVTATLIGCGVVIVLIVILCISVIMRTNIQGKYTRARNDIGEEMYTQLYMLCQTFDQVTVPGQDLENVVIPTMREYYVAARTLSDVMADAFGQRYGVLEAENVSALDRAFELYETAFRGGRATSEAQSAMQDCMNMIRTILSERFRDGVVVAA